MTNVKKTIGLFLGILCVSLAADNAEKKCALTGDTRRPKMSTFIPGEEVILVFYG